MTLSDSVLRWRPFLWLWGIAVAAVFVSMTWEGATSYDDGGIGTISFFLLVTVGAPFLLGEQLFDPLFETSKNPMAYYAVGLSCLTVFYAGLHFVLSAWLRRRKRMLVHSDSRAGA
jgi:hypothetical protein